MWYNEFYFVYENNKVNKINSFIQWMANWMIRKFILKNKTEARDFVIIWLRA